MIAPSDLRSCNLAMVSSLLARCDNLGYLYLPVISKGQLLTGVLLASGANILYVVFTIDEGVLCTLNEVESYQLLRNRHCI